MTCPVCSDKGLVRLNWADAFEEYGVCLCAAGLRMRVNRNLGRGVVPLWAVWCAREQIDPSRVLMVEDVLTADELRERGLTVTAPAVDREAALLAAGRARKDRR